MIDALFFFLSHMTSNKSHNNKKGREIDRESESERKGGDDT